MNRITSTHNPHVMHMRELLVKRSVRDKDNTFVVEGVRLVEEAAASGWRPTLALFSEKLSERGKALAPALEAAGAEVFEVPESLIYAVTGVETSQGVVAVFKKRELALPAKADFLVIADQVRDPGNLGTLLRTAAAAGCSRVLLSPGCAAAWSPKSLRAGQGAQWLLPVHEQVDLETQAVLAGLPVLVTALEGASSLWTTALPTQAAWVFGHEGQGVGVALQGRASQRLLIPMQPGSESLNVGVAAGICLFEHRRQLSLV